MPVRPESWDGRRFSTVLLLQQTVCEGLDPCQKNGLRPLIKVNDAKKLLNDVVKVIIYGGGYGL